MLWEKCAVLWNVLGCFLVLGSSRAPVPKAAVTVGRVTHWGCSLLLFSMPSVGELVLLCLLPCPQTHPVWRDTPAFWYFLYSVLCILWAHLPSNYVHRAQHFLCPTSTAGAAYPVQSSTTSKRVFLHPKSIENCKSVHHSQWAVDFDGLWSQRQSCEGELHEEVPTSALTHRISIIISPGAIPSFGGNICFPVLPCSLNLWKKHPLYQMWVLSESCFSGSSVVTVPSSSKSTDFPFPAPQREQ